MQHYELLENGDCPVEIGNDEIELVTGGLVIDDEMPSIGPCTGCVPPPPK